MEESKRKEKRERRRRKKEDDYSRAKSVQMTLLNAMSAISPRNEFY